jgi:YHS domain-containing protein
MSSRNVFSMTGLALLGVSLLVAIGCGQNQTPRTEAVKPTFTVSTDAKAATPANPSTPTVVNNPSVVPKPTDGDHAHKPGSHGGIIIPIGADSYHAEAVIEKGGTFRLLTLGKDESRIQEVEEQPIKAYVKVVGQPDAMPVELSATPQDGDAPGTTSQFTGELPEELRGQPLEVTIPNIRIKGERFRIGFTTQTAVHQEEMPASLPAAEEQALYLTPGGKYTEADIAANGKVTASQKFRGVISSHDMKPKQGDRICPVTMTKANPKFTWVIDGKPYQFCCPPCVDEFVKLAKEQPEEVKVPDTYIK